MARPGRSRDIYAVRNIKEQLLNHLCQRNFVSRYKIPINFFPQVILKVVLFGQFLTIMSVLSVRTCDSSAAPEKEGQLIYEKTDEGRRKWSSAIMGSKLSSHTAGTDFDISYEIEKNINMQVRQKIEGKF